MLAVMLVVPAEASRPLTAGLVDCPENRMV